MRIAVTGMTCQSCASRIQNAVGHLPGARDVSVNFALMQLNFEGAKLDDVLSTIRKLGYDSPAKIETTFQIPLAESLGSKESRMARRSFLISAALGAPLFVFAMGWLPVQIPVLAQAIFATIVVIGAGFEIHRRAFKQLLRSTLTMDTLVSLGSLAALFQSYLLWFRGTEHVGFEASSTIVMFILFGKFLEASARRSTFSATAVLFETLQKPVILIREGRQSIVSGLALKPGDAILLRAGETSPIDGVVLDGVAQASLASITGEPLPQILAAGTKILSGSVLIDSNLTVRVEKSGSESFLGKLLFELEKSQSQTVKLQRLADKVTAVFVPSVILLAVSSAGVQFYLKNQPEFSFNIFLSVLLVACPCALGLAIPTALVVGLGAAAKKGILFRNASVLEACSHINEIFFDKTGTITSGTPQLLRVELTNSFSEKEVLELAASVEAGSIHPLATAVKNAAYMAGVIELSDVTGFKVLPGKGIEGEVGDKKVTVVRVEVEAHAEQELEFAGTASDVFINSKKAARLFFIDTPRTDALETLHDLKNRGFKLHLLTGDNQSSVEQLGKILPFHFDSVRTELLPQDKSKIVAKARETNPTGVGFVGDGVNDVLALAQASVGFAVSRGAPAAIGAGQVTLTQGIEDLPIALNFASRTYSQLRYNLFWAFGYNLVMLPWAMTGGLNPMWASLAMSASSVSVVLGSLLLGIRLRNM